jgi:hypothetical protein
MTVVSPLATDVVMAPATEVVMAPDPELAPMVVVSA